MSDIQVRQLSSGYWHIRGTGPCNWCQPPHWPCSDEVLEESFFVQAGDEFRQEVRRMRDALGGES